ncbi:hypothetical protein GCM10027405_11780 [Arthrobacter alkaliphilus]
MIRLAVLGGMQLGRLFEGPWVLILVPIALAVVIVLVVVSAVNKSRRSDLGSAALLQSYAQGMNHRSTATIFGVLGIFVLGIVFGPLAIVQASKAEALGVKATAGKVLGWICVGVTALWLIFIVAALASR